MPRPTRSKLAYKTQRIITPKRHAPPQVAKGSEHWHQSTFISILRRINHPAAKWTFAVPNGFLKSKSSRLRANKEGVISGVADIFTPFASQGYHGLWIEFKVRPNTPTENQLNFGVAMEQQGYMYRVVYSWQEAIDLFCSYVGLSVDIHT